MNNDEAADNMEDAEPARFILMSAGQTFDGQERVMTRAAYDLQVLATAHSASCGHPGFVPDDYLEHLDGLSIETTITAAELCLIGTWQRVDDGYRVLDWEAVEVCLDRVREIRGDDPRALTWEREREAKVWGTPGEAPQPTDQGGPDDHTHPPNHQPHPGCDRVLGRGAVGLIVALVLGIAATSGRSPGSQGGHGTDFRQPGCLACYR